MPKINPYYIPKLPDTATVSYFNEAEWNKDLTPEELKQQEAIEASYIAEWEEWGKIAGYGPGFGEWLLKTTVVVGGGFFLGPIPAIIVGGVTAGTAKVIEENCDNEGAKKIFGFISDCGTGIATGGVVGGLVQGVGGVLAADLGGAGSNVGRSAAIKALKATGDIATSRAEYLIAASQHGMKVVGDIDKWFSLCKDLTVATVEADKHMDHVRDGYDYKSWCKVCNA